MFAHMQVFAIGRFVYLLLLGLLSASLVLKQGLAKNPVAFGLGLVGIYSIATSFFSYYPIISSLKGISLLLLGGFLFFVPPAIERLHPGVSSKEYILRMFLYFAVIIVISNGIYYFVNPSTSNDYFSGTSFMNERFRGYFINPNDLAALYGIFFLPILWHEMRKQKTRLARLLLLLIFILTAIELFATGSRAGILAGIVALCILIFGQMRWLSRAMIISIIGVILFGAYVENPENNFARKFIYRNEVTLEGSGRLPVWIETWNKFLDKPVFGCGLGVTGTHSRGKSLTFSSEGYTIEKGNSYLGALEELGLVGVAILLWTLFFPILRVCWKGFNEVKLPSDRSNIVLIAIVIAGLVNATFEAWLLSVGNFLTFSFWIFASLLVDMEKNFSYGMEELLFLQGPHSIH
jgi:O-antigen ligase